jgi:biotin operon repressor
MITTHTSATAGLSQCDLILAELQRAAGRWVGLPDLHRASGSMAVHSRIADLRARGLPIEHRNERHGRMIHSSYRLVTADVQPELF